MAKDPKETGPVEWPRFIEPIERMRRLSCCDSGLEHRRWLKTGEPNSDQLVGRVTSPDVGVSNYTVWLIMFLTGLC